jgi:SecY interacting protein Syd
VDFPRQEFDAEWISPCQLGAPDDRGLMRWEPVIQQEPVDFSGLENALELSIHQDIKEFYGTYWSAGLQATAEEGDVSLIQLWNLRDFDRLIKNLIGHAMSKRSARQPFTIFFATTDPDTEMFLSVHNETGEVLLEEPGTGPTRTVDSDLATFITRLTPTMDRPTIY